MLVTQGGVAIGAEAVQTPEYELDIVNDKVVDEGKYQYYDTPRTISEATEPYQIINTMLSGGQELDTAVLESIRDQILAGEIPKYLVKQAIQDAAQPRDEADKSWVEKYRTACSVLLGSPTKQRVVFSPSSDVTLGKWVSKAACKNVDHNGDDLFFPKRGESTEDQKATCGGCVVSFECLGYAIENGTKHGIWGGMSENEREEVRKQKTAGLAGASLREYVVTIRRDGLIKAKKSLPQAA